MLLMFGGSGGGRGGGRERNRRNIVTRWITVALGKALKSGAVQREECHLWSSEVWPQTSCSRLITECPWTRTHHCYAHSYHLLIGAFDFDFDTLASPLTRRAMAMAMAVTDGDDQGRNHYRNISCHALYENIYVLQQRVSRLYWTPGFWNAAYTLLRSQRFCKFLLSIFPQSSLSIIHG